jgi:hypothetical protein
MRAFKFLLFFVLSGLPVLVSASGLIYTVDKGYVINTDSVMPGYCQRNDDGHAEGVFRTPSQGIKLWRNYSPESDDGMVPPILKQQITEEVEKVDFYLYRTELKWGVYTLFGTLRVGKKQQDVVMKLYPLSEDTQYDATGVRYLASAVQAAYQAPKYEDLDNFTGLGFCILLTASKPDQPDSIGFTMLYSAR